MTVQDEKLDNRYAREKTVLRYSNRGFVTDISSSFIYEFLSSELSGYDLDYLNAANWHERRS